MPSAITAIRRYPATLLLAALLFLASFAIATGSFGIVGSGGDDDEGSGIGGTGRTGEFGGSGLGGTGAPSPFLGQLDTDAQMQIAPSELPTRQTTSPELALSPKVNTTLDTAIPARLQSPVIKELSANLAKQASTRSNDPEQSMPPAAEPKLTEQNIALAEPNSSTRSNESIPAEPQNEAPAAISQPVIAAEQNAEETSIVFNENQESQQLADSGAPSNNSEPDNKRLEVPERIQRPELPPIQRIRPVERISVLPPRALPMRI